MTADDLKTQFRQQSRAALSLNIAYIGVVSGLFSTLRSLGTAPSTALAEAAKLDPGYVLRWCDAAYAFGYLDVDGEAFRLTPMGEAMRPEAPDTLMPMAVQSVLSAHMTERAAGLMRTGERPGEQVLAERETVLPWFGPMLEANFAPMFERTICPAVPAFADVDARGGLAVDLGCGNGWYLRALARRCAAASCGAWASTVSRRTSPRPKPWRRGTAWAKGCASSTATSMRWPWTSPPT